MPSSPPSFSYAVIGAGRLGSALVPALRAAGVSVAGPLRRSEPVPLCDVVLLCVPESAIGALAASLPSGVIVGHCSASFPMHSLAPHERLVAHPLMPITKDGAHFRGAACAIDGSSERAVLAARELAEAVGMHPVFVPAEQRALYHAAASMAANYVTTLGDAAEQLAEPCGITRADLGPLIRAAVENWLSLGGTRALVGPVSRGQHETVAQQRNAVQHTAPHLLPLWDAMVDATRALTNRRDNE